MGALEQSDSSLAAQEVTRGKDCLSLYDRYSALAYGIILQIIPEPELAQTVLIDLFTSSQLRPYAEEALLGSRDIIRLARAKALESRPERLTKSVAIQDSITNDSIGKLVFDLSFYRGYSIGEIATQLQLTQTNVLTLIHDYFKQQRSS
ncbi:hypothetical protein [Spirosoma migulaei]